MKHALIYANAIH